MTIDIEKLIEEIDEDGSGEIEFDEFKQLLCLDWMFKHQVYYKTGVTINNSFYIYILNL